MNTHNAPNEILYEPVNSRIRLYGVNRPLLNPNESPWCDNFVELLADNSYFNATAASIEAASCLLALPGILKLKVDNWRIVVILASVFDWSDVHEDIAKVLQIAYFEGRGIVVQEVKTLSALN